MFIADHFWIFHRASYTYLHKKRWVFPFSSHSRFNTNNTLLFLSDFYFLFFSHSPQLWLAVLLPPKKTRFLSIFCFGTRFARRSRGNRTLGKARSSKNKRELLAFGEQSKHERRQNFGHERKSGSTMTLRRLGTQRQSLFGDDRTGWWRYKAAVAVTWRDLHSRALSGLFFRRDGRASANRSRALLCEVNGHLPSGKSDLEIQIASKSRASEKGAINPTGESPRRLLSFNFYVKIVLQHSQSEKGRNGPSWNLIYCKIFCSILRDPSAEEGERASRRPRKNSKGTSSGAIIGCYKNRNFKTSSISKCPLPNQRIF